MKGTVRFKLGKKSRAAGARGAVQATAQISILTPQAGTQECPETLMPCKNLITVSTHRTMWRPGRQTTTSSSQLSHPARDCLKWEWGGEKQRAKHAGVTHRGPYQTENVCSNPPS